MPWGKHKGKPLTDVPSDYLQWVIAEADNASSWLKQQIKQELSRRCSPPPRQASNTALSVDQIDDWFRRLARKYHPDVGGDNEIMKALQDGYEELKRMIE